MRRGHSVGLAHLSELSAMRQKKPTCWGTAETAPERWISVYYQEPRTFNRINRLEGSAFYQEQVFHRRTQPWLLPIVTRTSGAVACWNEHEKKRNLDGQTYEFSLASNARLLLLLEPELFQRPVLHVWYRRSAQQPPKVYFYTFITWYNTTVTWI